MVRVFLRLSFVLWIRKLHYIVPSVMPVPVKRSSLQSPNPIKHAMVDDAGAVDLVAQESCKEEDHVNGVADEEGSPVVPVPSSPASNRERFRKGFLPSRTCCNLDLIKSSPGTKFNLSAICIAVFPPTTGPDRRYIQLADVTGSVGISVWNHNVQVFNRDAVGRLVNLTKVVIASHNGKKQLTMARDSSIQIVEDEQQPVMSWWKSMLQTAPNTCGGVHDVSDNSIVTVCGILGLVSAETKMVQQQPKTLLTLHFVDASGKIDVRSWNHTPEMFQEYVDRPVMIRRVRVTSFAGTKICELLDGIGSVVETAFPGAAALVKFWNS